MGRKSGITHGGYHPQIFHMHWVMAQREQLREQEYRMMNKKKMRFAYWQQRFSNALDWLRTVDPQGWERWYDNDSNVPAEGTCREWAGLVEARVMELTGSFPLIIARVRRGIFIWQDQLGFFVYSKEVEKEPLYVISFDTFEAAESFINGLPIGNCGYGFVLDLLPVGMSTSVES